jgi:hypothetical protein
VVCGRSLTGIVGSYPAGCLSLVSVVFCQAEVSASVWSLAQRILTERGAYNWVWWWSLDNEAALAHWGLLRQWKSVFIIIYSIAHTWCCISAENSSTRLQNSTFSHWFWFNFVHTLILYFILLILVLHFIVTSTKAPPAMHTTWPSHVIIFRLNANATIREKWSYKTLKVPPCAMFYIYEHSGVLGYDAILIGK